jgi:hypothetical protein
MTCPELELTDPHAGHSTTKGRKQMNHFKFAPALAGTLLAAAVFGQAGLAHAGGCIYSVPWVDQLGARIARVCADGTAAGAISREPDSGGNKRYLVTTDLRRDESPDTNEARTELINDAGVNLRVIDRNFNNGAQQRRFSLPLTAVASTFAFQAGDNAGN